MEISQAYWSEISNLNDMFDESADGRNKPNQITGWSGKGKLQYERRKNEVFESIIRLGYYRKINWELTLQPQFYK